MANRPLWYMNLNTSHSEVSLIYYGLCSATISTHDSNFDILPGTKEDELLLRGEKLLLEHTVEILPAYDGRDIPTEPYSWYLHNGLINNHRRYLLLTWNSAAHLSVAGQMVKFTPQR